jgi:uncharacterized membrane protein HdeD (DUF308 family)
MQQSREPRTLRALGVDAMALADRWWSLALRGAAAILFGAITLFAPGIGLFTLVILFGAYAVVDGAFNLVMASRGARRGKPWGSLVFQGLASLIAGVLTFVWPKITALVLVLLISAWAVVTGISAIVAAIRLRKHIRGEWLLGLSGILSIAFGVLLFLFPAAGALTLAIWVGAYALVTGVLLLVLGFRLRKWRGPRERHVPTGGATSAAR